jgi:hypothetical protein
LVFVFLNHFQLLVHYYADIELVSDFFQDKTTHISDHIQWWPRRKHFIKTYILLEFLLEWFLKSLFPYILKDVSKSGVTYEEEAIFKSQQLDIIYAQSGLLYEIIPDALQSNYDPRLKPRTHADDIIGSMNAKSADQVMNELKYLSLNYSTVRQAMALSSSNQSSDVHFMYLMNPKGHQQPRGNKKKSCNNNRKGGNTNNKSKDDHNNDKFNNNASDVLHIILVTPVID